jgi:hypothetical protein
MPQSHRFKLFAFIFQAVTLTSDTLFDLLMLKLKEAYSKKVKIESKGRNVLFYSRPTLKSKWKISFKRLPYFSMVVKYFRFNQFLCFILGPRFEIKDFLVKLGSVTAGGSFKVW